MRLYFLLILLIAGCTSQETLDEKPSEPDSPLTTGKWSFEYELAPDTVLKQYVSIDSTFRFTFHNGEEEITTDPAMIGGDSIYIEMPVYHTYFIGTISETNTIDGNWYNPARGTDYMIPFHASVSEDEMMDSKGVTEEQTYDVSFSPNTDDMYRALGQFKTSDGSITGTFETETGDYRYLCGETVDGKSTLQCFDGSHVFWFEFDHTVDSITGVFKSGTHWHESFEGVRDDAAELRDPFEITELVSDEALAFTAIDMDGELMEINEETFANKVTIVQIFGSWCPNCLDESRYFADLHARYADQGLQILPIAFERSEDFSTNQIHLQKYTDELKLPYTIYLGGKASKTQAAEKFPMLSCISSFPTSLFIDGEGNIRHIHTGFYGPGTGVKYEMYQEATESIISELLDESTL
ncbi:MAG: TlpA family protein disulfide reductase [Flavobacteriales bacterium]|nr:TlpA family protein disulfide reductase [Flavobacteriales bacterium]